MQKIVRNNIAKMKNLMKRRSGKKRREIEIKYEM
jgi:hypothetical protein